MEETLPETDPRTCTRLGSSGGVNVGAGWCSSVKYLVRYHRAPQIRFVVYAFLVLFIWSSFFYVKLIIAFEYTTNSFVL